MKNKIILISLACFAIVACKQKSEAQTEVTNTQEVGRLNGQSIKANAINQKIVDYTFDMYSALGYKIGDNTEVNRYPKKLMLKHGADKHYSEGETWQVPKIIVADNDEVLIDLIHGQDHRTDTYVSFAEAIVIHSKKLKNAEGIGVGSTIDEFERTYPFSKIYYTYVSEKVWLENGIPGYRFYIDKPKGFDKKVTINADLMELSKHIFDKKTPITSIRITGTKGDADFIGEWKGKDQQGSDIDVQIYERDKKLYANIVAGVEVYHERIEELVEKGGKYFSLPTSSSQVRIGLKQVKPKQLSFYMDENPEFEPMRVTLNSVVNTVQSKKRTQNISSACRVLNFTKEGSQTFVDVQLIDLIENNENGFDIVEKGKRTFELVKEEFKNCKGQSVYSHEMWTVWEQLNKDENRYYIKVENGTVTEFYLENCAG